MRRSRATWRCSRSEPEAPRSWRSSRPTPTGTGSLRRALPRGPGERRGLALPSRTRRLSCATRATEGHLFTWLYGPEVPAERLIAAGIDLSVSSPDVLGAIVAAAREAGLVARIHLCVDTGLGREGVQPARLDGLMALIAAAQGEGLVKLVGIWSHFAWADQPGHATIDMQAEVFRSAIVRLRAPRARRRSASPRQLGRDAHATGSSL